MGKTELEYISIGGISATSPEGFSFVELYISLQPDETSAYPDITVKVPVKLDISHSVESIYEAALEKAKWIVGTANGIVSPLTLQSLLKLKNQLLVDEKASRETQLAESLKGILSPRNS